MNIRAIGTFLIEVRPFFYVYWWVILLQSGAYFVEDLVLN